MTNDEILQIALQQSAIDSGCLPSDFLSNQNKIVVSQKNPSARKYLELPFYCDLTTYGNNIVASVSEEYILLVDAYISKYPAEHCFETPNLHILMESFKPYDINICFMAEYFLPDVDLIRPLSCAYELRILHPNDFSEFYLPQWNNALCEPRKNLDLLAVGAFNQGQLIGLAGCSADCDSMYQIGVDVLPEYRRRGVASAITSTLAIEVLKRDKVPFYCCAWSNIKSAKNAVKSGFRPAWVQITAKKNDVIAKMNEPSVG